MGFDPTFNLIFNRLQPLSANTTNNLTLPMGSEVRAAQKVEDRYEDTGPWSDFEWGMINGKLSALRWMLGDEWDMLDT